MPCGDGRTDSVWLAFTFKALPSTKIIFYELKNWWQQKSEHKRALMPRAHFRTGGNRTISNQAGWAPRPSRMGVQTGNKWAAPSSTQSSTRQCRLLLVHVTSQLFIQHQNASQCDNNT